MSSDWQSLLQQAAADHAAGDLARAETAYLSVLQQMPQQADALHLLGVLRDQQGQHEAAVDLIRQALRQAPDAAMFHGNLGNALLALGRMAEAETAYRDAIRRDAAYFEGHYNLANLLRDRGETAAARSAFETALTLQPDHLPARNNLAMLLWEDIGDTAGAAAQFDRLLALAPDWPAARMNHGLFLLGAGRYAEGWREYEWRWRNPAYTERDWGLGLPRWNGQPLDGPLLLWGEQGVGDQILYGTMLADAAQRCGQHVIVAVDPRLVAWFTRSLAGAQVNVVPRGTPVSAAAQAPFGSMGLWLRLQEADFAMQPARGYLQADAARQQHLREAYRGMAGADRRIAGISWRSGNTSIGRHKSIPLVDLLPLLQRRDTFWVCLQYGDAAGDLAWLREHGVTLHHDPALDGLRDMDSFAAQVAALDHVVTVSNTAVHVAGALGIACHLLLARGRGRLWYWPAEGADSRWYPAITIRRQSIPGSWEAPVQAVTRAFDGLGT